MTAPILAPFPWFGGKSSVAGDVWQRFGDVKNFVEPFFGSGACLLARPKHQGFETINDFDGLRMRPARQAFVAGWRTREHHGAPHG